MNWNKSRVLVTGGTGFIGSHLVNRLLSLGADITVVDHMYAGRPEEWRLRVNRYMESCKHHGVEPNPLIDIDLEYEKTRLEAVLRDKEIDTVFHLAAKFGGRGFVDVQQAECSAMLSIDHNVVDASYRCGVDRLHYASSACVYPRSLQANSEYLLKEDDVLSTGDGWESSDNLYGFAKLMGELQLRVYHKEHGMKTSTCRYLTVYGVGQLDESHAIATLIGKAVRREDPYIVWGSGNQERGFTYVTDIVEGTILATERITDATPINLGWDKRYKIRDVASKILGISDHKPKQIIFDRSKPEGPFSRALDITRARRMLGWEPKIDLDEGLRRTIAWRAGIA